MEKSIARRIDHTLLRPDLTKEDILVHCQSAIKYRFKTVCIPPYFVKYAKTLLEDTQTGVCTVVGFPFGFNGISSKMEETKTSLEKECDELDFVVNIAAVKNEDWKIIDDEFDRLVTITHMKNKIVNAILETYLLSKKEIDYLCNKAVEHNVDFVKTSTGYSKKGSELEVVRFIKRIVKSEVQIKASGRIKTKDKALDFIDAGADRIATSSGIQIVS